ncbi:hypothetical protein HLB23_33640 [Nocardia uniformis]|uniref:KOW domain-containing protein n=1 Tax=Nocardia uniformis TaxID=53432 RepID=A0A849CEI1_9NOCA|nr:hypothetical protein [Nocardia uniformis]NNH74737.1 hypothetical protein [Nocardia uniformis]
MVTQGFAPGDVVFIPEGPFQGVCGVVRQVDTRRAQLRLRVSLGYKCDGLSDLTVDFDEVEWA